MRIFRVKSSLLEHVISVFSSGHTWMLYTMITPLCLWKSWFNLTGRFNNGWFEIVCLLNVVIFFGIVSSTLLNSWFIPLSRLSEDPKPSLLYKISIYILLCCLIICFPLLGSAALWSGISNSWRSQGRGWECQYESSRWLNFRFVKTNMFFVHWMLAISCTCQRFQTLSILVFKNVWWASKVWGILHYIFEVFLIWPYQ